MHAPLFTITLHQHIDVCMHAHRYDIHSYVVQCDEGEGNRGREMRDGGRDLEKVLTDKLHVVGVYRHYQLS